MNLHANAGEIAGLSKTTRIHGSRNVSIFAVKRHVVYADVFEDSEAP